MELLCFGLRDDFLLRFLGEGDFFEGFLLTGGCAEGGLGMLGCRGGRPVLPLLFF